MPNVCVRETRGTQRRRPPSSRTTEGLKSFCCRVPLSQWAREVDTKQQLRGESLLLHRISGKSCTQSFQAAHQGVPANHTRWSTCWFLLFLMVFVWEDRPRVDAVNSIHKFMVIIIMSWNIALAGDRNRAFVHALHRLLWDARINESISHTCMIVSVSGNLCCLRISMKNKKVWCALSLR